MSDDATDGRAAGPDEVAPTEGLEATERSLAGLEDRVVNLLGWVLDTETRTRICVHLREQPWSTSEEIAEGTGLYPSTVRESLADLAAEGTVRRRKRSSHSAGNNPFEYYAVPPCDLLGDVVGRLQRDLDAMCRLDVGVATEAEDPVTIEVEAAGDGEPTES